jgi:hypothetical protein
MSLALRSPQAPSAYVLAPVLWLLVLLATTLHGRRGSVAGLALAWVLVVGPPPLPDRADLVVNLFLQGFAIALCAIAVLRSARAPSVEVTRMSVGDPPCTATAGSSPGPLPIAP